MAQGATGALGTGATTNDAILQFDRTGALTVASAISGTGVVNQIGTGTTSLTGANTYSGTTTISAGVLSIGAGGAAGTLGSGAVANSATLQFNRSDDITVANDISGTGSLTQAGAGTTTLTGANSYFGITTISAGVLQVGSGGTAGTLGSGAVTNNATLQFNRSDDITVANVISGIGSLTQLGAGTTTLTGANSYSGTTTISAGTLQVGSGGTAGTLGSGAITNNAALAFNLSDDITVANDISGTGSLTQLGAGTTSLTGANTYSGTTTISAGTLRIGSATALSASSTVILSGGTLDLNGFSGTVTNLSGNADVDVGSGTLTVNQAVTGIYTGQISGTGGLIKIGAANLTLAGTNIYSGPTTITAGTLQVGSGGTTGTLGSGSVTNNAVLAFNRSDDITVANLISGTGGVVQAGTGTISLTGANSYSGTTTISAGTLSVGAGGTSGTLGSGAVTNSATLQFNRSDDITVANDISGTGSLTQLGAGTTTLTGANTYSGTTTISAGTLSVGAGGTSGTLGSGAVTNDAALAFNRSDDVTVANAISGTGALSQLGAGTTSLTGANTYSGVTTVSAGTLSIGGGGTSGTLGSGAVTNNATLQFNRSDDITVANVISGTGSLNGFNGRGTTSSYQASAYASFTRAAFYLDALAGYGYSDNQMTRQIVIPGLQPRTAKGQAGADQFLAQVEAGYGVGIYAPAAARLTPFARFQTSTVTQAGFTETGAQSLNLEVAQQTTMSMRSTLGLELAGAIDAGWRDRLAVQFRLGWVHEYADTSRPVVASFAGAPSTAFTVFGAAPQRDSAVIGFAANTAIAEDTLLYIRYDGEIGTGSDSHSLSGGLRLRW